MRAAPAENQPAGRHRKVVVQDMQSHEGETKQTGIPSVQVIDNESSSGEVELDFVELLYHLVDKLPQIIIVGVICAVLIGCWTYFFVPDTYEATTKLYVLNTTNSILNVTDLQIGSYLTNDYQQVFSNREIHDQVSEKLKLSYTYKELDDMIRINNPSDTRILEITVTSEDEREAVKMVEAYAEAAQLFIEDRMDSRMPTTFEKAALKGQVSKGTALKTILGFIVGALVMIIIHTVLVVLDDRVTTSEFIEKRVGIVTLGMMPVVDQDDAPAKARKKT